ncbi:MAG: hypothetical protein EBU97_03780, partial [Rhodobacteraceae bacterium]|nr:hypothetical protein [Paracoccaceae bacterium]
ASVNIRNNSGYTLVVNEIDATTDRTGVIQITDTSDAPAGYIARRTVYTQNAARVTTDVYYASVNGTGITFAKQDNLTTTAAVSDAISFHPKAGMFFVYTEGLSSLTQTIVTRYVKTFNLFFNFPAGEGDLYASSTVNLSDAPLLESESLQSITDLQALTGWADGAPTDDTEAFVRFKYVSDPQVQLAANNVVYNVTTGSYYKYTGAGLKIELSNLFDSNNAILSAYAADFTATTGSFTENDRDAGQYRSDFKNATSSYRQWSTGGGYMRKKTVWRETTTITGYKKYWDVGIRADKAVSIEFQAGSSTPSIRIESVGDMVLQGNVATAPTGLVYLNPAFATPSDARVVAHGGAISMATGATIQGLVQPIRTLGAVDITVLTVNSASARSTTPSVGAIDIESAVDINLDLGSRSNGEGIALVSRIVSTGGSVYIRAPQGIYAVNESSLISGTRVELQSTQGTIGTEDLAIRIDTDASSTDGGFAAAARDGVYVTEVSGDLALVQARVINTSFVRADQNGTVSVGASNGVVQLSTVAGSILDRNYEDDSALTDARLDAYRQALGLSSDMRDVVGAMLDANTRADYARYIEYWNLFRADLGDVAVSSDITTLSTYQSYVQARVAAGETQSAVAADVASRYGAIHAAWYGRPLT